MIERVFKIGLIGGILLLALGFANVFNIANPPEIFTLLAPYGQDLLVVGIIISVIAGVGLFVVKQLS